MKRLGENQKVMLEKLNKEGKIENIGDFYRSISSRKATTESLKNFIQYAQEEMNCKLELGKRGGLATAILSK